MTTETLPLAPVPPPAEGPAWLPRPGTYSVAPDRCIVELTSRLYGLPTIRGRLTATSATLTVHEEAGACGLRLELDSGSLHAGSLGTGRPLLNGRLRGRRGLHAERHKRVTFVGERIAPYDGGLRLHVMGDLVLRAVAVPATLRLRVVERTDDRLLAVGRIDMPYRAVRRATGFTLPRTAPARTLRLLVAAEFA